MSLDSKIPGWLNKIQFIKFWVMNPCEVPWTAYIETALPISGEVAIAMLGFDLRQFMQAIFRPKWARSPRHTRRGRRGKRRGSGIPDVNELLAERLDPDRNFRPDRWPFGAKMVLEWVEVTDRIAWTIFLFEAWDALIINTIVGVLQADKKICPNIARAHRSSIFHTYRGGAGGRGPVNVDTLDYRVNVDSQNGYYFQVEEGQFVITLTGVVRRIDATGTFAGGLRVEDVNGVKEFTGPQVEAIEDDWRYFGVDGRIKGPGFVQFEAQTTQGFFELSQLKAFIIQIGD